MDLKINQRISPLVELVKCQSKQINKAVVENLEYQFERLIELDCVQESLRSNTLEANAMIYDLLTGHIKIYKKGLTSK